MEGAYGTPPFGGITLTGETAFLAAIGHRLRPLEPEPKNPIIANFFHQKNADRKSGQKVWTENPDRKPKIELIVSNLLRNIRYCQDFSRLYFATPILPQVVAKSVDDK